MTESIGLKFREAAFRARLQTFAIVNYQHVNIRDFLSDAYHLFEREIRSVLTDHPTIKVTCCLSVVFQKIVVNSNQLLDQNRAVTNEDDLYQDADRMEIDEEVTQDIQNVRKEKQTIYIYSENSIIDTETDLQQLFLEKVVNYLMPKVDDVIMQGSGFTLSSINELAVQVNQFDPLRGSSYIKLPKFLADKRAIVNVNNDDKMCFKWAILSALFPAKKNTERKISYERYEDELDFTGIQFPMQLNHISKFEKQNPSISINVYMFDPVLKKVYPLRLTKEVVLKHIHLLLLSHNVRSKYPEESSPKTHYCWIKNLSRLTSSQLSNHNGRCYLCDRCLNSFRSEQKLELHRIDCNKKNNCQIEMPTVGDDIVKFMNIKNQVECPFIIYSDIEAMLKKPTENFCKSGSTVAIQKHEIYSIGYYLKCSYDDTLSYYKANRGPNCMDWFVNELL